MEPAANPRQRSTILIGSEVAIVKKQDQRTERTVTGTVKEILTNSATHPHGIKVRLTDGSVGRVKIIIRQGREPAGAGTESPDGKKP